MSVSRRVELTLPPNGEQLINKVIEVFKQDLQNHFRTALAYPNASFKIQWSSNFYCNPHFFQGSTDVIIKSAKVSDLEDQGLEPQVEMGSLEMGIQSGQGSPTLSPALTSAPQVQTSLPPPPAESRGRRDPNARRGVGIEFSGGGTDNPSLQNIDGRSIAGEVAKALVDVEKEVTLAPVEEKLLIAPQALKESGDRIGIKEIGIKKLDA